MALRQLNLNIGANIKGLEAALERVEKRVAKFSRQMQQIGKNGKLELVQSSLAENNRTEPEHLETWLSSNSSLIAKDIRYIGRQVSTRTGELDLLAIDSSGNIVVIELKRDKVPREALAQAIDYASDLANWDIDKLSEECFKYNNQTLV